MGLQDGIITVVLEAGKAPAVRMEVFLAECPHRRDPRLAGSCDCPCLAEAQRGFEQTIKEGLKHCGVRYGRIAFTFTEGGLRWVDVREKFKIDEEIAELGRIFAPHCGHELNAWRAHGTRGSRNGRHSQGPGPAR